MSDRADLISAIKRALIQLGNGERSVLCEPCGSCQACRSEQRARDTLADALERARARREIPAHPGALCRHCRKPMPGAVGVPEAVCGACGKRSIDAVRS